MKSVVAKDPFWKTTHSGCKVTVYHLNDAPNVHNAKVFKTNSSTQFISQKRGSDKDTRNFSQINQGLNLSLQSKICRVQAKNKPK